MSDIESKVEGALIKDHTMITDKNMQHSLEQQGFGEIIKKKFFLKPFESLYLLNVGNLKILKGKQQVNFNFMMQECVKSDVDELTKFIIYHDFRSRGYMVDEGLG